MTGEDYLDGNFETDVVLVKLAVGLGEQNKLRHV